MLIPNFRKTHDYFFTIHIFVINSLRDNGEAAAVVAEHEEGGPVRLLAVVPELQADGDVLQAEAPVLLVVDRGRGIEEVNGPVDKKTIQVLRADRRPHWKSNNISQLIAVFYSTSGGLSRF
jgi:hypothetical protein